MARYQAFNIATDGSANLALAIAGAGIAVESETMCWTQRMSVPENELGLDENMRLIRLPNKTKPTNNRGEVLAIIMALMVGITHEASELNIITDSGYSILALNPSCQGKKNPDIVHIMRRLKSEYEKLGGILTITKVTSHPEKANKRNKAIGENPHFHELNKIADREADYRKN